ncbi:MAG: DUF2779 domain-containing protein [Clostridia bacterium]|nr:DUF2779 domain-containing protein [Clostridia bacterium]
MSYNLSKSRYCSGVQCPKMLWLKKNKPEEFDDSVMNTSILQAGDEIGDLAMGLFGEFTEIPFNKEDLGKMAEDTKTEMAKGTLNIAEATFIYENLFCSVDILRNLGGNKVELYEVKSSTGLKDIYCHDIAFQYHILTSLGYTVTKSCLVHVNNKYVRYGELDIHQFFEIEDLTDKIEKMQCDIKHRIKSIQDYMEQTEEPVEKIGMHCTDPYDCGFFGYCTKDLPKPNIFNVRGVNAKKKFSCYYDGLITYEDLLEADILSKNQNMQLDYILNNLPPAIDKNSISDFLQGITYPLYFLDFETFQPAIPLYDGTTPFTQIVFQYSLHYIEHEGGELHHKEFLAYPGDDPRRALAEQLCKDIPLDVCTTAYNMSFEKGRIAELANLYPDLRDHLMNIHSNIVDLMVPFQKKWYYCKAMDGSYSIKYVLPALCPDDPSLDYHNLEGVHNGAEASATFTLMAKMSPDELEESRKNLLKYCCLDTYAMVKVWEKLREICE